MYSLTSVIIFCLFTSVTMARKRNSEPDSIGFPESEEDPSLANKDSRHPVFIPATCPVDELYYPGDQKDDWICDCRPAYLYHPKTDRCWAAYRIGPCESGSHLVLGTESAIPYCVTNPCRMDGFVMYNGRCEMLGSVSPCTGTWPNIERVAINSTTLTVACEPLTFESRFKDKNPNFHQSTKCPPGSKRSMSGKLTPTLTTAS